MKASQSIVGLAIFGTTVAILVLSEFLKNNGVLDFVFPMGRSKISHEFISNGSMRRATFRKRRAGMLKKLSELTTLCGVVACAVIYNPYESQIEVWPSPQEAFHVLKRFQNLPTKKQEKYMLDQKAFLNKQIGKLNEQLEKERKKLRRLENDLLVAEHLDGKGVSDLNCLENLANLGHILDEKIEQVSKRLEFLTVLQPAQMGSDGETAGKTAVVDEASVEEGP